VADTLDSILHRLPSVNGNNKHRTSDQRVLTIRVPADLHAALQDEARARKTSVNRLAVAKLAIKAEVLDHVVEAMAELDRDGTTV